MDVIITTQRSPDRNQRTRRTSTTKSSSTFAAILLQPDQDIDHRYNFDFHNQSAFQHQHDSTNHPYLYEDGLCIRPSHYGFDELWTLKEEEEERSLILKTKFNDQSFTSPIWAESFHPQLSPPHDANSNANNIAHRASVSSVATTRTTRSLTDPPPFFNAHDEMTTLAQRPESPPELTSSKSSKSSSFQSSTFSGFDGVVGSDLAHFEDIGLDDDHSTNAHNALGHSLNKKSSVRNLAGPVAAGKNHSPALPPMRELVNGAPRNSLSGAGTPRPDALSSPASSLSLPPGARRPMASPQTINQAAMRNRSRSRSRSRSPSPAHLMQGPITPSSIPSNSPALRSMRSFDKRRLSSGPSTLPPKPRKTAKEIENDYNDSDEDLPDEASLWNVPMSPQMYRTASSAATSANASASTSPERPSKSGTPKTSKMTPVLAPKTAPIAAKEFPPSYHTTPPTPNFARLSRGNTTGTMPDTYAFGKGRVKSWNNALSDLSDEAKALSEALDAHEVQSSQKSDVTVTEDSVPDMPPKPLRSKTSLVELPPLRTNNVMIDPLPISKEKQKVLSRTRPSWLPPKNPKEEKKHLKEYQRMMSQSLEAEKKRAAKQATEKCARDDTTATLQRLWTDHVLPHWDATISSPRTRELWWRGIPPSIRPSTWSRAITNQLSLTPTTYTLALARAHAFEASFLTPSHHSTSLPREAAWLRAIRRDCTTTLPSLALFQPSQPLHAPLIALLSAYAFYRPDVGYVYGTHLPAALLLLVLREPADAFTALANLLNRPLPLAFLTGDPVATGRAYELVLRLLGQKRPGLGRRLFGGVGEGGLGLSGEEVLEPVLRTLFLVGCGEGVDQNPMSNGADGGLDGAVDPARRESSSSVTSNISTTSATSATTAAGSSGHMPRTKGLSLTLALRLWDIIVFDGDSAVIRIAVGLLAAKESALYGTREEVLALLGWGGGLGLQVEDEEGLDAVIGVVRDVGKESKESKGDGDKRERRGRKEKVEG